MKKTIGFTVTELFMTLAIASVISLLAVPSFRYFQQLQYIHTITQAIDQSLSYARLQAVLRHETILIIPKEDNWQRGWNIVTEKNKVKNNNKILRDYADMPLEIKLIIFQQKYKYLKITSQGTTEGYNGHFEYGGMSLVFNRGGRTYLEKTKS